MPIPERTQLRYEFYRKYKIGDRIRQKSTGRIFIVGPQRNVYECILMCLNPMGRAAMRWKTLLEEFEPDARRMDCSETLD